MPFFRDTQAVPLQNSALAMYGAATCSTATEMRTRERTTPPQDDSVGGDARGLLRQGLSRDAYVALGDAFAFDGARCERVVAGERARLARERA
jgi:hypothetical protein